MSEETKEVVRLLFECVSELMRLDPHDGSLDGIKYKLQAYFDKYFTGPVEAANQLCTAPIRGK